VLENREFAVADGYDKPSISVPMQSRQGYGSLAVDQSGKIGGAIGLQTVDEARTAHGV